MLTPGSSGMNIKAAHWTNLLEEPLDQESVQLSSTASGAFTVPLDMRGFEIKTLQIILA
jgi:dihydroxyacetone kinase